MVNGAVVKPGRILENGILHSKLLRALIHAYDEFLNAPRRLLGKRGRRVVRRGYYHRFQKILHAHFLARLQVDLRTAHV